MAETTIDIIAEDKNGGVILTLNQFLPWNSPQIYSEFEQKLNGYIQVIVGGKIYEKYPDLRGKPIRIRLYYFYEPPPETRAKLDSINQKFLTPLIRFEEKRLTLPAMLSPWDKIKGSIRSFFKGKASSN